MNRQLRVLLLIPHLGGGGAERVTGLVARCLSREKYQLHLGLITQTECSTEWMPDWVGHHPLGAARVRKSVFSLLRLIWRLRPDVILSGMAHLNFLVLFLRPLYPRRTVVLVRQNASISAALAPGGSTWVTRFLYRTLYPRADRILCQTRAMAIEMAAQLSIPEHKLSVLSNPLDVDGILASSQDESARWDGPGPHLLAIGRLSQEKGYDLLLTALSSVRLRFPQTDLTLCGVGPEEAALRIQCQMLGLEGAVRFAGYVKRPETYFSGASIFVLASRQEGMPNALLEAAAGGLPMVALPASNGVVDLLLRQPGVWLAREVSSGALTACLLDALETLRSGERFQHEFVEQFRLERAMRAYERVIDSAWEERSR